jgi:diguanylate cyclase (GGDEF)-like protein/PAS domain S-box-containing protein
MPFNLPIHDTLLMYPLVLSICALSAFLCAKSMRRAQRSARKNKASWTVQAGMSIGCGSWIAHFVMAMCIAPASSYTPSVTLLSLAVGIGIAITGATIAASTPSSSLRLTGGAIIGLAVVCVHQIGSLAAVPAADRISVTGGLIVSVIAALMICAIGMWLMTDRRNMGLLAGSATMAFGVALHHAIGFAGLDPTTEQVRSVAAGHLNAMGLALLLGAAAMMMVGFWILNILQRKRILALVAEKDRNLRILIDSVEDYAICTLDPSGRISNWNAGAQRLKGYETFEVLGKSFAMFFPQAERNAGKPAAILQKALTDGRHEEEGIRLRKDGSSYIAHAVLTPMYERDGRLIGYAKVTHDITKMREDSARLAEITHNFDTALRYMSQGLSLYDADHRLVFANRRAMDLFAGNIVDIEPGVHFRDIIARILSIRGLSEDAVEARYQQYMDQLSQPEGGTLISEFPNGLIYSITNKPLPEGGWVSTIDDITARRRNEARIHHMAHHDALTGLPNRDHFNAHVDRQIERANRGGTKVAMLAIDLDRFKEINDLRGHAAGDQVLKVISERLQALCSEDEFVSRIGGDEFAALQSASDTGRLHDFATRLNLALHEPIDLDGYEITPGGSIGISIFPDDATDRELLMNNADLALYRAKGQARVPGCETICYYEPRMDEIARARRALAKDLWQAIANGEFRVHYQVQKSVSSQAITGYEALIRWRHPQLGPISPADFIPVAEECGAIIDIGEWVLRTACAEAAAWTNDAKVAVNLSPLQLAHPDLPGLVQNILLQTGLSPQRLELEITETSIISDKVRALHVLRRIKALGVTIAIDDFGTGYSSLDTLNAFPFDKIKIDRSFLREAEHSAQARAIIRAILALGRSLEVPVLAEGVETISQLELLRSEGCDEAQGFYLGRPAPIKSILEFDGAAS